MKHSSVLIACLFIYAQMTLACSEAGFHKFNISKSLEFSCAKDAKNVVAVMANTMPKTEKNSNSDTPGGESIVEGAALYKASKDSNGQNVIGYNVSLTTENHWHCNYCVEMVLDSKNRCYVVSASRFMCAK